MSVISIRPSSVALKGLSSAPLPNRMPHIPQNIVADKSIVPAAAGRLAQTIQHAGGQLLNAGARRTTASSRPPERTTSNGCRTASSAPPERTTGSACRKASCRAASPS